MSPSYRRNLRAAIAAVLPLDDLCAMDRRTPGRWRWYALAFVWRFGLFSRGATLGERLADARGWLRALAPRRPLGGTYQGFVKALRRRGDVLSLWLAAELRGRLARGLRGRDLLGDWRPLAADVSRFDCPRSRSCQGRFRRAGRAGSPPQLALATLWHLVAHCWWDFRVAPAVASERALILDMLGDLPGRALVVGDAGFIGYDFCAELMRRGVAFLLRVGANVGLLTRLGAVGGESPDTVYLWPQDRRSGPPVVLRLIVVGSGRRRVHLVTGVLEPRALSRAVAAELYRRRWGVETAYRSVKQTLARRKLCSRAADLAVLELVGVFLAGWALALWSLLARGRPGLARAWSPARSAAAVRSALAGRCRSLRRELAAAVTAPRRRGAKKVRQKWPHQKNDAPCRAPRLRRATRALARKAKRFTPIAA